MARDFDDFPVYDPIVRENNRNLADLWVGFLGTFIETLQEYLSQNGIFVPRVTTAERDALQNVIGGQLIYNTTLNKFQGYELNAWVNLV